MTVQDTAQQTPADRFRVGIDIGGTKIEAVLVDPQDNVRNDVRIPRTTRQRAGHRRRRIDHP